MFSSLYKRDLSGFFYSSGAYIIYAIYAVLTAIMAFFWGEYLDFPDQSLLSVFAYQPQILIIIIPAITIRSWSDEHKNGTLENLLTYPISSFSLVMAKFSASFTISAAMLVFSLPLLFCSSFYLQTDWGNVFCSYLGALCMIAVLCAAGCLISFSVASPAAAYLLGLVFAVLWIDFNWGKIITSNLQNIPFYFDGVWDFSRNYQNFLNGQLNPASLFYFISFCMLLLLFNWLTVSNRRAAI